MNIPYAKILYVLLCITVPVLWGLLVSWLFGRPNNRRRPKATEHQEEPPFPDYQI